jgi:hypothetical protein
MNIAFLPQGKSGRIARMRTGRSVVALVVLLFGMLASPDARAALITWEFEAVSRVLGGQPSHAVNVLAPGDPLRGSLTFESATPQGPSTGAPVFPGAITSFTFEAYGPGYDTFPLGWFPITLAATSSEILVGSLSLLDRATYTVQGADMTYPSTPFGQTATLPFEAATLILTGPPGFTEQGVIPEVPPNLSSLDPFAPRNPAIQTLTSIDPLRTTGLYLSGIDSSGLFYYVDLELTSLHAVPEPELVSLLVLTALGGLCKRQRRGRGTS